MRNFRDSLESDPLSLGIGTYQSNASAVTGSSLTFPQFVLIPVRLSRESEIEGGTSYGDIFVANGESRIAELAWSRKGRESVSEYVRSIDPGYGGNWKGLCCGVAESRSQSTDRKTSGHRPRFHFEIGTQSNLFYRYGQSTFFGCSEYNCDQMLV